MVKIKKTKFISRSKLCIINNYYELYKVKDMTTKI